MKLHSDILTESDIREALASAQRRGNVAPQVQFAEFDAAGSRSRKHSWNIGLEAAYKADGDKRLRRMHRRDDWAATYEEWGWFIAELFAKDENMIFGTYKGWDSFLNQTNFKFEV